MLSDLFKLLGEKAFTIGRGGNYRYINDAVNAIGTRLVKIGEVTENILAINGFNGINLTSNSLPFNIFLNYDLIKIDGRYYKLKSIVGYTPISLILYENYMGASYFGGTSVTVEFFKIDRRTLLLLPGEHSPQNGNNTHELTPGFDVIGITNSATIISEYDSFPAYVFANVNENNFFNFKVAATRHFADADAFCSIAADAWGGSLVTLDNMSFDHLNHGVHSGGILSLPSINNGILRVKNSTIFTAKNPILIIGGASSREQDKSVVEILNSEIIPISDYDASNVVINAAALAIWNTGTYRFKNVSISQPQNYSIAPNEGNSIYDDWGGLWINEVCDVTLDNCSIDIKNTDPGGVSRTLALSVTAAATVTVNNSSLKTAGTLPTAIYNNGGTITLNNVYVEGSTYSINNAAGTVNINAGCYLNGPVTGTLSSNIRGTAVLNGATPVTINTTKVHTGSKIKLSRLTAGGTMGHFSVGTITNNTSFTIIGQALDTSTIIWELEE